MDCTIEIGLVYAYSTELKFIEKKGLPKLYKKTKGGMEDDETKKMSCFELLKMPCPNDKKKEKKRQHDKKRKVNSASLRWSMR